MFYSCPGLKKASPGTQGWENLLQIFYMFEKVRLFDLFLFTYFNIQLTISTNQERGFALCSRDT